MKKLLLVIFLNLVVGLILSNSACAQTPEPPKVCISQAAANKCSQIATELVAARDVIAKYAAERITTDAERNAATILIKSLNDVIEVRGRIIGEYDRMMVVYQKVIDMQTALITKLTETINKPKSAYQKFITVLKEIAILAAGIALGRGGL